MSATMSWMNLAASDTAPVERLVHKSVRVRQWMGFKQEHAMEDAALALGTTPRRVRGFIRGEVFKAARGEYNRLLHRWRADIDKQAAELTALAIQLEKEAEAEWSAANQYSLPLDEPASGRQSSRSASGAGATGF